jgi:hypothetical protein
MFLLGGLLLLLLLFIPLKAQGNPLAESAPAAAPSEEVASEPTTVKVGMFFLDISRLDVRECEFQADFYIWFKAPPDRDWAPDLIEFTNGTVISTSPLASSTLGDGTIYWTQRMKTVFRGRFDLKQYPFDHQDLLVILEDRESPAFKVRYVPDIAPEGNPRTWLDPYLEIPDWKIRDAEIINDEHHYQTDFGLGDGSIDSPESYYSRLTFKVSVERLFLPHMIKFVIPLLIIAGMAYLVFWINAKEFESQCAICVTSLLSAVALHSSLAGSLPSVGYLVIADKIFILFYVMIFSALVQTVAANNEAKRGNTSFAANLDVTFQVLFPVALGVGALLIWGLSGVI